MLGVGTVPSVIERDAAGFWSLRRQIQVRRWIRDNIANTFDLGVARIAAAQAQRVGPSITSHNLPTCAEADKGHALGMGEYFRIERRGDQRIERVKRRGYVASVVCRAVLKGGEGMKGKGK